jgi:hypothetical protein
MDFDRLPFDQWWTVLTTRSYAGEDGVFIHPVAESAALANGRPLRWPDSAARATSSV